MPSPAGPAAPRRLWADRGAARLFRLALVSLAALAAAAPWVVTTAIRVIGVDATTPIDWVPASFPARQAYAEFTAEFESGDVVIASWPGCTLDAASVGRFLEAATGPRAPRNAAEQRWFADVASGREALERLTAPPLSLDRGVALERLTGMLVGPDGEQTCVVIGFTPGRARRSTPGGRVDSRHAP